MSTSKDDSSLAEAPTLATNYASLARIAAKRHGPRAGYLSNLDRQTMSKLPADEQADWLMGVSKGMLTAAQSASTFWRVKPTLADFVNICTAATEQLEAGRSQEPSLCLTLEEKTKWTDETFKEVERMSTGWSTAAVLTTAVSAVALGVLGLLVMRGTEEGEEGEEWDEAWSDAE